VLHGFQEVRRRLAFLILLRNSSPSIAHLNCVLFSVDEKFQTPFLLQLFEGGTRLMERTEFAVTELFPRRPKETYSVALTVKATAKIEVFLISYFRQYTHTRQKL